ncbi:hypothetical protein Q3G72_007153 [Acer saccharum]|nr:hypothetical protein Q3G72_007153 [Acer saccharum]
MHLTTSAPAAPAPSKDAKTTDVAALSQAAVDATPTKFYDEADKNYWKAIAELLPIELPTIEINKGNKDHEKKPPIVVIHGPKPTDHSRMQQVLLKLKHIEPNHLKPAPVAPAPSKAA